MAACTTVTVIGTGGEPITRTNDEFRTYAETVFRLQNAVLDELISATDLDPDLHPDDALRIAETRIVASCRHLNETASISAEGREPGWLLQLRVLASIASCEASASAAKALLERRADTAIVSTYL